MKAAADELAAEPAWTEAVLEEPQLLGVEQIGERAGRAAADRQGPPGRPVAARPRAPAAGSPSGWTPTEPPRERQRAGTRAVRTETPRRQPAAPPRRRLRRGEPLPGPTDTDPPPAAGARRRGPRRHGAPAGRAEHARTRGNRTARSRTRPPPSCRLRPLARPCAACTVTLSNRCSNDRARRGEVGGDRGHAGRGRAERPRLPQRATAGRPRRASSCTTNTGCSRMSGGGATGWPRPGSSRSRSTSTPGGSPRSHGRGGAAGRWARRGPCPRAAGDGGDPVAGPAQGAAPPGRRRRVRSRRPAGAARRDERHAGRGRRGLRGAAAGRAGAAALPDPAAPDRRAGRAGRGGAALPPRLARRRHASDRADLVRRAARVRQRRPPGLPGAGRDRRLGGDGRLPRRSPAADRSRPGSPERRVADQSARCGTIDG